MESPSRNALQDIDIGEEFTEEETATLPQVRKRLIRKSNRQASAVNQLLKWAALLTMTTGSAFGANWLRQEKIKAGFCGVDSEPVITKPGASGLEEVVNQIRPQCVPCPPHATCYPGFRMTCDEEFQKVQNPLSFGGLIPMAAECAPDTEKLRRIKVVADEIVETLRDRTASVACGYTAAPADGNVGMSATEIKQTLITRKAASLTDEQFSILFDHAIEDVKTREEVEISSG
ncbi:MAG: hypothetical protein EOO38_22245 [Cytophagaceae bacterium]|nr:MAG: hypothetical protein EOO38_22245 [Cytophagaceae bacterium]